MKGKIKMIELNIKPKENIDLYLFGSSVYSDSPNDIDLAIIYNKRNISIRNVINYRKELKKELIQKFKCPIDILLLTTEEEKEAKFLPYAKHRIIYKTTHNNGS